MLVIIDYNLGNIGSIPNMLRREGIPATVSSDPAEIEKADRLILPGVGAFDHGMENLETMGLRDILDKKVREERVPIMGMCLGMQLMTTDSEEGKKKGLGWVDAHTVHLKTFREDLAAALRFPHIGWNFAYPAREHPLLADVPEPPRYYFVHTYKVVCSEQSDILYRSKYGGIAFTAGFVHDNVVGMQFHPEKSHKFGKRLLTNFARWTPEH